MYAPRRMDRIYFPKRNLKMTEEQEVNNEELEVQEELEDQMKNLKTAFLEIYFLKKPIYLFFLI